MFHTSYSAYDLWRMRFDIELICWDCPAQNTDSTVPLTAEGFGIVSELSGFR